MSPRGGRGRIFILALCEIVLSKTVILPRAIEILDHEEQPATGVAVSLHGRKPLWLRAWKAIGRFMMRRPDAGRRWFSPYRVHEPERGSERSFITTLRDRLQSRPARRVLSHVLLIGLACHGPLHVEVRNERPYPGTFGNCWYNARPVPPDLGVVLSFRVETHPDALVVSYSLKNNTDRSFSVVSRPAREWDRGERDVQIDLDREGLMLSMIVLPEPWGMGTDCDGDRTPELVTLDPGGAIFDRFRVPLPARVDVSMRRDWLQKRAPIRHTRSRRTSRITLTMGMLDDLSEASYQLTLTRALILPHPIEVLDDDEEPER